MTSISLRSMAFVMGAFTMATLAGCLQKTTSSENTKTSDIFAELKIIGKTNTSATVEATLKLGGPGSDTFVDLAVHDSLIASAGTDSKVMQEVFLSEGFYTAQFSNVAENTVFAIELLRNNADDEQAPASMGTLPAPFTLGAVIPFSRSLDDFTITWDPSGSGDTMHLKVVNDVDCPLDFEIDLPGDPGSYTLPKARLKATNDRDSPPCTLQIELTRTRKGAVDPHYARGSSLELSQVRRTSVRSTP